MVGVTYKPRPDDSPGEREKKQQWQEHLTQVRAEHRVKVDRRKALTPDQRRQEDANNAKGPFNQHLTPRWSIEASGAVTALDHYPIFQLQRAPGPRAACRLPGCNDTIPTGEYRVALDPGPGVFNEHTSPSYYHLKCFECLFDQSSAHHIARLEVDRDHFAVDEGAKIIVDTYISRLRMLHSQDCDEVVHEHPNIVDDSDDGDGELKFVADPDQNFHYDVGLDIVENALTLDTSSRSLWDQKDGERALIEKDGHQIDEWTAAGKIWAEKRHAKGYKDQSAYRSSMQTAPSKDEEKSWSFADYFDEILDEKLEVHALSEALDAWKYDQMLVRTDPDVLDEPHLSAKEELDEEAVAMIKQYGASEKPKKPPRKRAKKLPEKEEESDE